MLRARGEAGPAHSTDRALDSRAWISEDHGTETCQLRERGAFGGLGVAASECAGSWVSRHVRRDAYPNTISSRAASITFWVKRAAATSLMGSPSKWLSGIVVHGWSRRQCNEIPQDGASE